MERINDKENEKSIIQFLKKYSQLYCSARNTIGVPINETMLNKRLQELSIQLFKDKNNPKTFKINSLGNYFDIIINNLTKSKAKENILLLLKEYTNLTSHFSNELASITKNGTLSYELNKYKDIFENNNDLKISYTDAYFGIVALNEVISQWCAEKCNSVISNVPLKQKNKYIQYWEMK